MASKQPTLLEALVAEYPQLAKVELDGKSDFARVAEIIGSRNPKLVWPVVNACKTSKTSAKVERLSTILAKYS